MKHLTFAGFVLLLLSTFQSFSDAEELPIPSGKRFKDLVPIDGSAKLLVGASLNSPDLETPAETILNREFQFVTPGTSSSKPPFTRSQKYGGGRRPTRLSTIAGNEAF